MICRHKFKNFTVANARFMAPLLTCRIKNKLVTVKLYNFFLQIIQTQTCYLLIHLISTLHFLAEFYFAFTSFASIYLHPMINTPKSGICSIINFLANKVYQVIACSPSENESNAFGNYVSNNYNSKQNWPHNDSHNYVVKPITICQNILYMRFRCSEYTWHN